MKFGPVPLNDAAGAVLAHSVKTSAGRLRKGLVLGPEDVSALRADGIKTVTVAQLDSGDLDENAAAAHLAAALVPDPAAARLRVTEPFTGRVNLIADGPGVVELNVAALEAFNRVHPMITLATVPPWQQMANGGMVATIKIISYAVPEADVARAADLARDSVRLLTPVYQSAGLAITDIPGGPSNDKGIRSIRDRVEALGMTLNEITTVPHETARLAQVVSEMGSDIVMILTGSATSDIDDVVPSAVRQAGGQVTRFGMPVDPGNLLFLGDVAGKPVIGLPGCARSPALNGADWVLSRIVCGVGVSDDDIAAMGVGGLLKEIPTRPQPRAGKKT